MTTAPDKTPRAARAREALPACRAELRAAVGFPVQAVRLDRDPRPAGVQCAV